MRRLLISFFVLLIAAPLYAKPDSVKRTVLIQNYYTNLNGIWNLSKETAPPDYYLSSLGVSLLSSNRTDDQALNAKLDRAAASILYVAASASLLEVSEQYKSIQECNKIYKKNLEIIHDPKIQYDPEGLCVSDHKNKTDSAFYAGVCLGQNHLCGKALEQYKPRFDEFNKSFKMLHDINEQHEYFNIGYASFSIEHKLDQCRLSASTWAKKIGDEIYKTCLVGTKIDGEGSDNIFADFPYEGPIPSGKICNNKSKYPRLPLIMTYTGQDINGFYCEGSLLKGIEIQPKNSLKMKYMILKGSTDRSFHWLQMAEEAFERTKNIDKKYLAQKINLKEFEISGGSLCNSPIIDKKRCISFSESFLNSIKEKNNFNYLKNTFESINYLGNIYNTKKKLSAVELGALDRLSNDLEMYRNNTVNLKFQVQDLINAAGVNFNYEDEANKL